MAELCHGKTSKGKPCLKKTTNKYCHLHVDQRDTHKKKSKHSSVPTTQTVAKKIDYKTHIGDCPICLEEKQLITLSCGHGLDEECAMQMIDDKCPLCRRVMDVPSHIKQKINVNMRKYAQEQEREAMQSTINLIFNLMRDRPMINGDTAPAWFFIF